MINAQRAQELVALHEQITQCELCQLYGNRTNAVPGEGPISARIMFVGEAPGQTNDQLGRPFVGHGGRIFDRILQRCLLDRKQVFITNIIKCWPPGNRKPREPEIDACNLYLQAQIQIVSPVCIVTLGTTAYEVITGSRIKLRESHGQLHYVQDMAVCPTFHPNAVRYIKGGMETIAADIRGMVERLTSAQQSTVQYVLPWGES